MPPAGLASQCNTSYTETTLSKTKAIATPQRWILLIHQLPPRPTNLRVRIWRKLQKLGAVAIKNSVYVLPANEKTNEDFQWLKQEIESAGGEAAVFRASQNAVQRVSQFVKEDFGLGIIQQRRCLTGGLTA